ncbi:MAG: SPOR domain-containing protein [Humidesulfovibrio sp.]|nr:SPOR domain-containing protein [Humidesulfovibrio sp.]
MNSPIKIKDPGAPGRVYTFNCSFGELAAMATAVTLALSLFFVLGVLVGRGHRPESAIPQIERIMPTENVPSPGPSPEILKAEELQYSDQLAKKGPEATLSKSIDAEKPNASEKAVKAKKGEKAAAPAKASAKPDAKASAKPEVKAEDNTLYDYTYQVASFPEESQAKAFLKRVKAKGLKASIENGTANNKAWFRVVVFFRGTPEETRSLKEKLAALGAPKPLMRGKTPL